MPTKGADRLRRALHTFCSGILLVLVLPLSACDETSPPSDPAAADLLQRMVDVEEQLAYRGRKRIVVGEADERFPPGEMLVTHYAGGPTIIESTRGPRQVLSRSRLFWLADEELLRRNYEVRRTGAETVVGRPATVLEVVGREPGRPSMKLWVDEATGLLLVSESRNWRGGVSMRSEFLDLEVGPDLPPPPESRAGRKPVDPTAARTPTPAAELPFPPLRPAWLPAGFEERGRFQWRSSLRTVYSDGLGLLELTQRDAPGGAAEEGTVTQRTFEGVRTQLEVVIDGVKCRLVGRLSPEELLRVVESLEPEE